MRVPRSRQISCPYNRGQHSWRVTLAEISAPGARVHAATSSEEHGRGLVKSAERSVMIIETLAASPDRLTLGQLRELTGYPRSSLHALLRTLAALKWIEGDSVEGEAAFGVGPRALLCGTAY